jgi:hypothetical protein
MIYAYYQANDIFILIFGTVITAVYIFNKVYDALQNRKINVPFKI